MDSSPSPPCSREHLLPSGCWFSLLGSCTQHSRGVRGSFCPRMWEQNCRSGGDAGTAWLPLGFQAPSRWDKHWELPLTAGGKGDSLAGPGICWGGAGNLNVPEAKSYFCVTVWHHTGNGGTQAGKSSTQPQFLGVRSQPSPCPCPGRGSEASSWNILLSLAVLEIVCAHPWFPLPEVFGQNNRSWEKWIFRPLEKGPNQGLLGSAASEFPNSCPCFQSEVGHWDCRHQRGSLMACAWGICSFPLPPRLSIPN